MKATGTGMTEIINTWEYTGQFTWQCSPASGHATTSSRYRWSPACREAQGPAKILPLQFHRPPQHTCEQPLWLQFCTPTYSWLEVPTTPLWKQHVPCSWLGFEGAFYGKLKLYGDVRKACFLHTVAQQKCRAEVFVLPVTFHFLHLYKIQCFMSDSGAAFKWVAHLAHKILHVLNPSELCSEYTVASCSGAAALHSPKSSWHFHVFRHYH